MPRVETYQADQVLTQVVRGPRATVAPSGNQAIAQGLSSLAGTLQREQNRLDEAAAEEAVVNFEREKNRLFFDPQTGYFNTQGRDAFDQAGAMNEALEELKRSHSEKLKSPNARQAFDRVASKHITRSQQDIARHSSKHLKAWEVSTINSQVENTLENASLYWADSERLGVQNALGRQSILDAAELEGVSPEVTQERLETYDSSFARSVVSAATLSSSTEGKEALDKWRDRLEGPDLIKINTAIEKKEKAEKNVSDASFSVTIAESLLDKYESKTDAMSDPIVENLKETDASLYKQVRSEISAQHRVKVENKNKEETEAYHNMIDMVNNGATPAQIKQTEYWDRANPIHRNNILNGKHIVSDHIALVEMLSLPTRQLAEVDPNDPSIQLSRSDRTKLAKSVENAKKGAPQTRIERLSSKANRIAEQNFGDKGKWKKKNGSLTARGEQAEEFLQYIQSRVNEIENDQDRKIRVEEENELIENLTRSFLSERSFLGVDFLAGDLELNLKNTPAPHLEMLNTISNHFDFDQVSRAKLAESYDFLVQNNIPVSPNTLQNEFEKLQNK